MPNFIDVMVMLDDVQRLLNIMVKDIHMINMILIKGDKK
jgi:hypothetical protein